MEFKAPGVVDRQPVKEPLQTGIKAIDSMIPIGRGQRELIIGDRTTGKTAICVDTIINQKGQDVICIYVAIGQKASNVRAVEAILRQHGAMDYTIIVAASATEAAPIKYMAPYAGCAMGEHFLYNGQHALVMYDDLSKHADAYRQMSLLVRRPPGREAYPGDVFYLHSRLLERAVKLSDELGGGLAHGAACDRDAGGRRVGLHPDERHLDHRRPDLPASRTSSTRASVRRSTPASRCRASAATPRSAAMKKVAGRLRLDLAAYRELEAFSQFASELDAATQRQLARGERWWRSLNQPQYAAVAGRGAGRGDLVGHQRLRRRRSRWHDVPRFNEELVQSLRAEGTILKEIAETGDLSDETARDAAQAASTRSRTASSSRSERRPRRSAA